MPKIITTSDFINRANKKHKNKYDYSKVEYKNSQSKVVIICPIHGEFLQIPNDHLFGYGCSECAGRKKLTINKFIEKANKVHDFKYDYSNVIYKNIDTKITIICPTHGEFLQIPYSHLIGKRCYHCAGNKKLNTQEFINKSNKIHNNFYDYSETNYLSMDKKIIIICKIHGKFQQLPSNHITGKGCQKCGYKKGNINKSGWRYSNWLECGLKSKHFDSFKVYIIKCWNDEEEFYKIGKTYRTVKERFKNEYFPYKYNIIEIFESKNDSIYISNLEKEIQNKNKEFRYIPKNKFNGYRECYIQIKEKLY